MTQPIIENFLQCAKKQGVYLNSRNLFQHLRFMFGEIPLHDKRLLDVGGGAGLLTLWAAIQGAEAVCLEPEDHGSTQGILEKFSSLKKCIDDSLPASILCQTVQEFLKTHSTRFDVIIMANSINHLDEENCIRLQVDQVARDAYITVFNSLYQALEPGGYLIVSDCSRSNFFNDIGLKSPIMKTIEWEKHQSPNLWSDLLQEVGFEKEKIQWTAPNSLGGLGRLVFGNRLIAYFLFSHFRLVVRKPI